MSAQIRVLIVDDSALMRQMLKRFLTEAGMDVVATARDGDDGLDKIAIHRPDVITLDVEMPRMNGLDMLRQLMKSDPLPVVMVSSVTQAQAPAAVEALMLGAVDIVAKPGGAISLNLEEVQEEIVRKVRAAAGVRVHRGGRLSASPATRQRRTAAHAPERTRRTAPAAPSESVPTVHGTGRRSRIGKMGLGPAPIVVGSSTGGPSALSTFLGDLPADFPRPIVIVQHMPAGFTTSLAKRLDTLSSLAVAEVRDGIVPRPGEAWIAPGGLHVLFDEQGRLNHDNGPPHLGVRPAVDLTLESAVRVWGRDVIAVILTGMGVDGARGARALKQVGGRVLAQDEDTSVVYGMPRAVKELGLTDGVYPLHEMAGIVATVAAEPMNNS